MKILFSDIPLDKMSVSMTMNGAVIPIMAMVRYTIAILMNHLPTFLNKMSSFYRFINFEYNFSQYFEAFRNELNSEIEPVKVDEMCFSLTFTYNLTTF